jgi:hypothetical protein
MRCRSNYRRICERPASTLQLMAGSCKKPLQLPVVQLFERVGKVSRQHVSRRQFFGAAHGRSGLLGGCQACRSVSATRLLSAFRLKQIRRLLLRAIRWHAANYAATDKTRQVGQELSNKRFAGSRYVELDAASEVPSLGIHSWRQRAASQASIPTPRPRPRCRRDRRGLADDSNVLPLRFILRAMRRGRQLQHPCVLTFTEPSDQQDSSVRKF